MFVRALFLRCIGYKPSDSQLAEGAEAYLKAYREGNDAEARTEEWLQTRHATSVAKANSRKLREGRRDFC